MGTKFAGLIALVALLVGGLWLGFSERLFHLKKLGFFDVTFQGIVRVVRSHLTDFRVALLGANSSSMNGNAILSKAAL